MSGARGSRGPGRPKGSPNKTTKILKDAILQAADEVGLDGKGKGGLVGYCKMVAVASPQAFCGLLGKVLPTQLSTDPDNPLKHAVTVTIRHAGPGDSHPAAVGAADPDG